MGEIWHLTSQIRLSWKFLMVVYASKDTFHQKGRTELLLWHLSTAGQNFIFWTELASLPSSSSAHISKRKRHLKRRRERERENQMKRAGCSFLYALVRKRSRASLGIISTEQRAHSSSLLVIHKFSSQMTLNSSIRRHRRAAYSQSGATIHLHISD